MSEASANRRLEAIKRQVSGPRAADKVVIITGTNSPVGIGCATVHQFAQNGAKAIYMCDFEDSNLEANKKELEELYKSTGTEFHTAKFDASDEAAVKGIVDTALERYGRLDVFFANAGITGQWIPYTDISVKEFEQVLKVNTIGPFLAAKYAAPAMAKTSPSKPVSGGSIVMTASVAGMRSNAGPTPYSASKAAVVSIVQTICYQLVGTNVRINAVCPGLVYTNMTASLIEGAIDRGNEQKIGQLNPLHRACTADEIARVVMFLGSEESSYVTGQAWAVDGGLTAGHPYIPGKMA